MVLESRGPEMLFLCSGRPERPLVLCPLAVPHAPTPGHRLETSPSSVQPIILSWGSTLPSWLWWDSLPVSSDTSRVSFQPPGFSVGPWGNPVTAV